MHCVCVCVRVCFFLVIVCLYLLMQSQSRHENVCVNYLYGNKMVNTSSFQTLQEFHSDMSGCKIDVRIV